MERLTEMDICQIFCQLSDAVQYIHQRGVIHCAITSHAVQLMSTECAKLTNFDYAKRQEKSVNKLEHFDSEKYFDFISFNIIQCDQGLWRLKL